MHAARCIALLVAAAGCAAFRGDKSRELVEVNASFAVLRPALSAAAREDFEGIYEDHVVMWAAPAHLADLRRHGIGFRAAEDVGATNFAAEQKARYRDTKGAEPDWAQYCGYECLTDRLAEMAATGGCAFPFELQNIGSSYDGRDIWAVKVGSAGPEVLIAANIHGDETTGGQLVQRWLWNTCHQPTPEQTEVATSVVAWYIPMYNPDGFERNRRGNGANHDLNRNMPQPTGGGQALQPEARALIAFEERHSFAVGIMFHGGAVVCNTAYDNCYTSDIVPRPCPPASVGNRDAEVVASSRAYCDAMMNDGVRCTIGSNCQVNGASWYQITGSVQDWEYHFKGTLSMTMEVTSTKRPAASTLPGHYTSNYNGIHQFMMYAAKNKKH